MIATKRDPRKTAKQARSRQTVSAILDAVDRVARRTGVEDFSIVEVAREAAVARASIYDFFPTREALLAAWEERLLEAAAVAAEARARELFAMSSRLEIAVHAFVNMVMEAFADHAVIYGYGERFESRARPSVRMALVDRVQCAVASALADVPERGQLRVARLDVAARIIVQMVLAVAPGVALARLSTAERGLNQREIATMIYRYLLADPVDVDGDDRPATESVMPLSSSPPSPSLTAIAQSLVPGESSWL